MGKLKRKQTILLLLCGVVLLCLMGCGQNISETLKRATVETGKTQKPSDSFLTETEPEKAPSSSPVTVDAEQAPISYVAENEKYALALPNAEQFVRELQDFIYWEYATMIEKDTHGFMSVLTNLEENNCLEKELKLHLYYYECDVSEMDEGIYNYYSIVVLFPEESQMSYYSFQYTAKGLSSDYDYEYNGWFDEDEEEVSAQELEEKSWFQEQFTFFGETSLTISKKDAENYKVNDYFEEGEKEQLLSAITNAIQKEYGKKKNKDLFIYVRDFLPGDSNLAGEVVDLDMTSKYDMPLWWIRSLIYYKDAKMEKFDGVYWGVHYSSAYSGSGQPNYNPAVAKLKEWAKEEKEAINVEKCILAYQVKNGELVDLKAGQNDNNATGEAAATMN